MKKYFVYAFILLFSPLSMAEDVCFDMQCLDCAETYEAQHLRIKDFGLSTLSGYVQANDDSWGSSAVAIVKGNSFVFARHNSKDQDLYDIDLNSYDGNTALGTRYRTQYQVNKGETKHEYTVRGERQMQLVLMACP